MTSKQKEFMLKLAYLLVDNNRILDAYERISNMVESGALTDEEIEAFMKYAEEHTPNTQAAND